ncbi:MAG: PQQ-binding-like beta-propeller repeat protein, partial [Planctomycetota bacterium]
STASCTLPTRRHRPRPTRGNACADLGASRWKSLAWDGTLPFGLGTSRGTFPQESFAMHDAKELMFVGLYGHVTALLKSTGEQRWTTSLPGTGYGIVTLLHEDGALFAASSGRLFALEPKDGSILWSNELAGLGNGDVCLATVRASANAGPDPIPQQSATRSRASDSSSPSSPP